MNIHEIQIQNYKQFKELNLTFPERLSVSMEIRIVETNILESIAIGLSYF